MANANTNPKPETVCTRFSRINLDPDSVREFIGWLCGMDRTTILNHGEI